MRLTDKGNYRRNTRDSERKKVHVGDVNIQSEEPKNFSNIIQPSQLRTRAYRGVLFGLCMGHI